MRTNQMNGPFFPFLSFPFVFSLQPSHPLNLWRDQHDGCGPPGVGGLNILVLIFVFLLLVVVFILFVVGILVLILILLFIIDAPSCGCWR